MKGVCIAEQPVIRANEVDITGLKSTLEWTKPRGPSLESFVKVLGTLCACTKHGDSEHKFHEVRL